MCVLWSHLCRVWLRELISAVVGWSVLYTPLRFHQTIQLFDFFFLLILYPVTLLFSAAGKGPWSPQWNLCPFPLPHLDHIQLPHDTNLSIDCGRKGGVPGALVSETSSPSHGHLFCVGVKSVLHWEKKKKRPKVAKKAAEKLSAPPTKTHHNHGVPLVPWWWPSRGQYWSLRADSCSTSWLCPSLGSEACLVCLMKVGGLGRRGGGWQEAARTRHGV